MSNVMDTYADPERMPPAPDDPEYLEELQKAEYALGGYLHGLSKHVSVVPFTTGQLREVP